MSTVIGMCTDCIISVPIVPINTLSLRGQIASGQSQVIRNIKQVSCSYDATDGLIVQEFSIPASGSLALPTGTTALMLSILGSTFLSPTPLSLTISKTVGQTTNVYEVVVNQLYLSDDTLTAISISNPSTTAAVSGVLTYVPAPA